MTKTRDMGTLLSADIRRQMAINGVSINDIARKTGMSVSSTYRWIAHPDLLSIRDFKTLNSAIKLDPTELIKVAGFNEKGN